MSQKRATGVFTITTVIDGQNAPYDVTTYGRSKSRTSHSGSNLDTSYGTDGWGETAPQPTTTYPYIWRRIQHYNSEGTLTTTSYICDTGATGDNGKDAQYIYIKGTARDVNNNVTSIISPVVKINDGNNLATQQRGLNLVLIDRQTLTIDTQTNPLCGAFNYDTYGEAAGESGKTGITDLIAKLAALDNSVFVCLVSFDAVGWQRPADATAGTFPLITALQGFGMGDLPYTDAARYPFLFIGYKNLGKGNGLTRMRNVGPYTDVVELSTYIANGAFTMKDGENGIGIEISPANVILEQESEHGTFSISAQNPYPISIVAKAGNGTTNHVNSITNANSYCIASQSTSIVVLTVDNTNKQIKVIGVESTAVTNGYVEGIIKATVNITGYGSVDIKIPVYLNLKQKFRREINGDTEEALVEANVYERHEDPDHPGEYIVNKKYLFNETIGPQGKVTTLEATVGDANSGLVKNVNTLTQTAEQMSSRITSISEDVRKISNKEDIVDLTALDATKAYPVVITLGEANTSEEIMCGVERPLRADYNAPSAPTYYDHAQGFSLDLVWNTLRSGWGANVVAENWSASDTSRFISSYKRAWLKMEGDVMAKVAGSIGQVIQNSCEFVYLRGGSKYKVFTSFADATITLYPAGYTYNYEEEGVSKIRVLPVLNIADLVEPVQDQRTKNEVSSEITQTASNISLNVQTTIEGKLHDTGIEIQGDSREINLQADKVTFSDSQGGNTDKISIDPATGTLNAVNAKITGATFIDRVDFQGGRAYEVPAWSGPATGKEIEYYFYNVTVGESYEEKYGSAYAGYYGIGEISLKSNHLFIYTEGLGNYPGEISEYYDSIHGTFHYSKLRVILPPPHLFIGQSIVITNQSFGFDSLDHQFINPRVSLEQAYEYDDYSGVGHRYICFTDRRFIQGTPDYPYGEESYSGIVNCAPYHESDTGLVLLNGVWQIEETTSQGYTVKHTKIIEIINLEEYEWLELTAVEGYQKDDWTIEPSYAADYNAMWIITRFEKKQKGYSGQVSPNFNSMTFDEGLLKETT